MFRGDSADSLKCCSSPLPEKIPIISINCIRFILFFYSYLKHFNSSYTRWRCTIIINSANLFCTTNNNSAPTSCTIIYNSAPTSCTIIYNSAPPYCSIIYNSAPPYCTIYYNSTPQFWTILYNSACHFFTIILTVHLLPPSCTVSL